MKYVYIVVALSNNEGGCPHIIGAYTNKQTAEKAAANAPYWWCNVIKKEVTKG